ncbi:LysR family transcriptional regulator [Paenibacillus aurantiacus]|uniref:LysR family transcriptional regulator n=1 Tax=Paenibacillus aurantiacus TaxID=1936118 RepID=A0ABV5KHV6_9BACL
MEFSLEWYRVFYWTAKLGSLTKAAEQLHITQPAVSHTLKQLEAGLGGPLFFRTAKGVTLTGEGEMLFRYIEQGMQLIDLGERKLAEMHNLECGEISIGASDTLCRHFLLPQLERFHRRYPDIRIKVTNRTTPETLALLKEGRIDFGLVNLPADDPKVDFRPSASLQECLVGGPAYAELAGSPLPINDLRRYPLLLLESGGSTRRFLDDYALACGAHLAPEFELGSLDLLAQFAQSGFGLTIIAREYVTDQLASGLLVEIPLHPPIPARHIGIATLKGVPLSSAASRFLEFLP